ncbi:MAG: hypothetical protein ACK6DZ_10270, partial [Acidobacteriota bacterium]
GLILGPQVDFALPAVTRNPGGQTHSRRKRFVATVRCVNSGTVSDSSRSNSASQQFTSYARHTKLDFIDIKRWHSATAKDGKITGLQIWMSGEEITYQFDDLERLISVQTASLFFGLS